MIVFRFAYSYFSSVDWKWIEGEYLAESSAAVVAAINKECPPDFRTNDQRYVSTGKRNIDTLVVEDGIPVPFPYHLPKLP